MYNPNYIRILNSLKQKIENGIYKDGEKLPSQEELSQEYGVSMMTLRHAMDILEQEGLINRKQGMGTFVSLKSTDQGHVLVVEDESQTREVLKETISNLGYEVEAVEDGYRAISAVQRQKFHLVFLDLRLPGISGIETLKRIREIDPHVAVVVVTGYPEDLLTLHSQNGWPAMVVPKPFKLSQIKEALNLVRTKR